MIHGALTDALTYVTGILGLSGSVVRDSTCLLFAVCVILGLLDVVARPGELDLRSLRAASAAIVMARLERMVLQQLDSFMNEVVWNTSAVRQMVALRGAT